jgi:hypothetical protein
MTEPEDREEKLGGPGMTEPEDREESTLAEDVERIPLGWLWAGAVVIAGCVVGLFDPVEALNEVIQNKGLSSAQIEGGAFIAGFTAPLTVATTLAVYLALSGRLVEWGGLNSVAAVTAIYYIAGYFSSEWGLGLAPSEAFQHVSGNPRVAFPINTFLSFFTAYGFPLMIAGALLGTAGGITALRWFPRTGSAAT